MSIPINDLGSGSDVPSFSFSKPDDRVVGTIVGLPDDAVKAWKNVQNDDGTTRRTLLLTVKIDKDKCVSHRKVKHDDGTTTLEPVSLDTADEWNVWVPESSRMIGALRDALGAVGATEIKNGAQIMFKLTGYGQPKKAGWSAPKLYTAAYKAPVATVSIDDTEEPF